MPPLRFEPRFCTGIDWERVTANPEVTPKIEFCPDWRPSARNERSSLLSRLKNGKVLGVIDEDAPEEPYRQHTVEPLCNGILL